MKTEPISFIGHMLIIPIALSGICLSIFFNTPTANAMEQMIDAHISDEHTVILSEAEDYTQQVICCASLRTEHNPEAITQNEIKSFSKQLIANFPHSALRLQKWVLESIKTPPDNQFFRPQSFLTGTVVKRE